MSSPHDVGNGANAEFHGGIEWPIDPKTQKPSTTVTGKKVWIASLKALIDPDKGNDANDDYSSHGDYVQKAKMLIDKIERMPNKSWRHGYIPIIHEVATIMAMATPDEAIEMSKAGLDALHSLLVVPTPSGDMVSAGEAVLTSGTAIGLLRQIETVTITPSASTTKTNNNDNVPMKHYELASPHRNPQTGQHVPLTRNQMKLQLQTWSNYGCLEPSVTTSASYIADMDDATKLVQNKCFVLLGGTSALGPAEILIRLGATICVVARPGEKLYKLIALVKDHGPPATTTSSTTTLFVPRLIEDSTVSATQTSPTPPPPPGADLIRDAPELARWITALCPEKQLVLCSLAYMDGEKNVRAGVAMDLIVQYVCERRADTALSYIISPSTAHVVPDEAAFDAKRRLESPPLWHKPFIFTSMFKPSNTWKDPPLPNNNLRIFNGLVDVQGPNYALTKTSQQWRAMLEHHRHGRLVSANHGPPSRTENMVSHSNMEAVLEGMQYFEPNVAFDVQPAKSLLTALMLYDLNCKEGEGKNEREVLAHPMCLFNKNSVHGGCWRCPYSFDSVGAMCFVMGRIGMKPRGWCPEGALAPVRECWEK